MTMAIVYFCMHADGRIRIFCQVIRILCTRREGVHRQDAVLEELTVVLVGPAAVEAAEDVVGAEDAEAVDLEVS